MNNYEPELVVGKTHKKIENPAGANPWGDNGVNDTELEEAACAFIRMKNGATIMLETSWALNNAEPIQEGSCVLCGSKAGVVAFYDGESMGAQDVEAMRWIDAVINDTQPLVLPEQACVVSEILEAIYVSSETGKPVYFD